MRKGRDCDMDEHGDNTSIWWSPWRGHFLSKIINAKIGLNALANRFRMHSPFSIRVCKTTFDGDLQRGGVGG